MIRWLCGKIANRQAVVAGFSLRPQKEVRGKKLEIRNQRAENGKKRGQTR